MGSEGESFTYFSIKLCSENDDANLQCIRGHIAHSQSSEISCHSNLDVRNTESLIEHKQNTVPEPHSELNRNSVGNSESTVIFHFSPVFASDVVVVDCKRTEI